MLPPGGSRRGWSRTPRRRLPSRCRAAPPGGPPAAPWWRSPSLAGGFVAGTHAGYDYNSFPLMGGQVVPDGYARMTPFLRNLTENIAAVQFDHRALATLTALLTAATLIAGFTTPAPLDVRLALGALGLTTAVQYGLGVATLLLVVPTGLAAHQANAVLVLTAALALLHALRRPFRPRPWPQREHHAEAPESAPAAPPEIGAVAVPDSRADPVLEAMPVGVAILDPERRIVFVNAAFHDSLSLPPNSILPGTPAEQVVRASAHRGMYRPGDPEAQVAAVLAGDRTRTGRLRRRTFKGRSFDVLSAPLPNGGYVLCAAETTSLVTARADAESALTQTTTALDHATSGAGGVRPVWSAAVRQSPLRRIARLAAGAGEGRHRVCRLAGPDGCERRVHDRRRRRLHRRPTQRGSLASRHGAADPRQRPGDRPRLRSTA